MKRWVPYLLVLILLIISLASLASNASGEDEPETLATAKIRARVISSSISNEDVILRLEVEDVVNFDLQTTSPRIELVNGEKISVYIWGGFEPGNLESASLEKDDKAICIIRSESTTDGPPRWVADDDDVDPIDTGNAIPNWVIPVSVAGIIAIIMVLIALSYHRFKRTELPKHKGDPNYRCGWCNKPVRLSGNSWYCDHCQDYPSEVLPPKH